MKRFVELTIPTEACNLKCSYCYLAQNKHELNIKTTEFKYKPEEIRRALSIERLGGVSYINICATGETLIPKETFYIAKELLQEGHYLNIITNGTLKDRIRMFEWIEEDQRKRMSFMFSLHYLELKKHGLVDVFFENYNYLRSLGYGNILSLTLTDEYIECLDEIKSVCMEKTGYIPQLAPARKFLPGNQRIRLHTWRRNIYIKTGTEYGSKLFDVFMSIWRVPRKEFCYSGDWKIHVDAATGMMRKCQMDKCPPICIFDDAASPIPFEAVGNNCNSEFCWNGNAYLAVGVIPEVYITSYGEVRNVKNKDGISWISPEMVDFLSGRLSDENKSYNWLKRFLVNRKYKKMEIKK